jgi:hypothetical protein
MKLKTKNSGDVIRGAHRRLQLLDNRRNDTLEERGIDTDENKLPEFEQKWLNRVSRMEDIR